LYYLRRDYVAGFFQVQMDQIFDYLGGRIVLGRFAFAAGIHGWHALYDTRQQCGDHRAIHYSNSAAFARAHPRHRGARRAESTGKKGDPLIRFDRRPYEYKVRQAQAAVANAKQNVEVLKADVLVAEQKIVAAQAQLDYDLYGQKLAMGLAGQGAGSEEESQRANAQAQVAKADLQEARAELVAAQARYNSQIDGVNTSVVEAEANLDEALYYLENTTIVAPEDGRMMNLQVRPGMVAGIVRVGAIASFICDDDRYLLATYFQENLKFVKPGQEVEVALQLYPGQIFKAKVADVWKGSAAGQFLPSGRMHRQFPPPPMMPQGQFGVKIVFDDPDQTKFPIGGQGIAAIYTEETSFAYLRRVAIRTKAWGYFLYPLPI
jgi:multidrug resistance efflux pump